MRAPLLAIALACAVLAGGCAEESKDARVTEYREAEFAPADPTLLSADDRRRLQTMTAVSPFPAPNAVPLAWRRVALPRHVSWGEALPPGGGRIALHWYRIVHTVPAGQQRVAVYVPRFQPGLGRVEFFVDGQHVAVPATTAANHWNQPFLFDVPAGAVAAGTFDLRIGVVFDARATYALAPVWIGAPEALAWRAAVRRFLQSGAPESLAYAFLVLGAFAFGFWWRRRGEPAYLLFALATVVWWLRTLHYHSSVVPLDAGLWWWITVNSLTWLMVLVYQFALRFHGQRWRIVEYGLWALVVATGVLTLPRMQAGVAIVATATYVVQVVVSLGVTVLLTRQAMQVRTRESIVLAIALWISIAFGGYDLLLKDGQVDPRGVFLLPYAAIFLFGAFLYAVLRRYTGAIEDVERLNASLEERLAARTRELQASHEKLRAIEREQTLAAERQRLMRDMHDGLGSSLMSSLVLVEQGRLAPTDVAKVLRECIDDLKLTIDSLEPIGSDLVTLLATLRYRLGSRLEGAGLRLDWRVADLPLLPWLDALAALEVLRILQEALTNVVKHSGARSIAISTAAEGNEVRVLLVDDGHGFDVERVRRESPGRGLLNLERRAAKLGGSVRVASSPAGTTVELVLKIERRDEPRSGATPDEERRSGAASDGGVRPV
jgi:signal transduction histidine kinase